MANLAGELTGLSAHDTLKAPTETSPGASAGFVLAAPAGTLVTGWDYVGGVDKNGDDDWTVSLATAEGQAVETCTIPPGSGGCTSGSSYYSGELSYRRVRTGLSARGLRVEIRCDAPPDGVCLNGWSIAQANATLYSSRVTIEDPTLPVLGPASGSLLGGQPYHEGVEQVSFGAQDNTGVAVLRVLVDGAPAATASFPCDYTYTQPCAARGSADPSRREATLTLDTTQLSDGPHTIALAAEDAAGNVTTTAPRTIVVDNVAPPAVADLRLTDGAAQRTTNAFALAWHNPTSTGRPLAATRWRLCPATGGACEHGERPGALEQLALAVPSPGAWDFSVWLLDDAGKADPAAARSMRLAYAPPLPPPTTPDPRVVPQTPTVQVPRRDPALRIHAAT
ncbi:MAG: hypothetical protein M3P93_00965, partial [Actinomycetota bacterium]|nr:hypothetical protein [Actinomycetota bacterium]